MSLGDALFSMEPSRGLELARACLGLTFAAEFAVLLRNRLYADDGILSLEAFVALPRRRSSLFALDFFRERSRWLLWLGLASSSSMAVGFLTKPAILVSFIVVSSTTVRYKNLLHAGLTFASLLVFFLLFSPAGSSYSVDRLLGLTKLDSGWSWGHLCAKLQVNLLYAGAVVSKLAHPEWRDGTLTYRLLSHDPTRTRLPMPRIVASWAVSRVATYAVIATQVVCPLLLWWRGTPSFVAIGALFLLHGSMSAFLNLRLFPFYVMSGLALFV